MFAPCNDLVVQLTGGFGQVLPVWRVFCCEVQPTFGGVELGYGMAQLVVLFGLPFGGECHGGSALPPATVATPWLACGRRG